MKKSQAIGTRTTARLKRALAAAARDDQRKPAHLLEKIVSDYLKDRGYLK